MAAAPVPARAKQPHHPTPKTTRDPKLFAHTNGACATNLDPIYHYADLEDIFRHWDKLIPPEEMSLYQRQAAFLHRHPRPFTEQELNRALLDLRKRFKSCPRKSQLLYAYNVLASSDAAYRNQRDDLLAVLTKKASKSNSGVLVITVLTSPYPTLADGTTQRFSCAYNCYFCPNEPGQPRSYLHDEPAVMRANANGFDAVMQFHDRAGTLAYNGHPVDKIEILILGGTWCSYPRQYQEEFVRDLFFSANTFYDRSKRPRRSLGEEMALNETAPCKIIGVTLETRPDTIDAEEIRRFRMLGCTRVQLGLQHTDDAVLKRVNRGHTTDHSRAAIRRLKDAGFKVDVHLMPCLPGADPSRDEAMFADMLYDQTLSADQWKIYPCEITPWTVVEKWYNEGSYVPYGAADLLRVLRRVLRRVHPWIRLNRVIRDIPSQYILGGAVTSPNMRQDIDAAMAAAGEVCNDIRSREVRDDMEASATSELVERRHLASHRVEYFLSFETPARDKIAGFLRLRLPDTKAPHAPDGSGGGGGGGGEDEGNTQPFEELRGCALIRELHVYGPLVAALFPEEAIKQGASRSSQVVAAATARATAGDASQDDGVAAGAAPESAPAPASTSAVPAPSKKQLRREERRRRRPGGASPSPSPSPPPRARQGTRGDAVANPAQHRGIGRQLMERAEAIAREHGYAKIAVIAGVGARQYYRRIGYEDDGGAGQYLIKTLGRPSARFGWLVDLLIGFFAGVLYSVCSSALRAASTSSVE